MKADWLHLPDLAHGDHQRQVTHVDLDTSVGQALGARVYLAVTDDVGAWESRSVFVRHEHAQPLYAYLGLEAPDAPAD